MVNCGACGKFLSPTGAAACSVCPTKYHRACLVIAEKTQISKDWVCPNCKRHVRRGDNSQTPVKGIGEDGDCGPPLPVTSPPAQARVAGAGPALAASESAGELGLLREAFAAFTVRLDGVERRLEALERGQPEGDPARVTELEQSVLALKRELNERDQDALLSDLEIGQLPEQKGESVLHSVLVLAGQLGVPLEERDVVFAERVGVRPAGAAGRPRRVVVRLASRRLRDDMLAAARVRRAGLAAAAGVRVFINERLTRHNRHLFHRVRGECRRLQWRYTWTKRGRIFARRGDGKPVYQFRVEDDLVRAFGPETVDRRAAV
ncbi:hypothetical protein ACJJTC_009293 [Scirpophaga incertulas]